MSRPGHSEARSDFYPEVHGLRAIAVLAVLGFHLWPSVLPGGFVGVDVFFVISGYLITRLAIREIEGEGRLSLSAFYARRIKRILPAATLVLVATSLMVPFLPAVRWDDAFRELGASAVFVQNWWLHSSGNDYLATGRLPLPARHYWSLAVEEQFYLAWPMVLSGSVVLGRRFGVAPRGCIGVGVAVTAAASLVHMSDLMGNSPSLAFYATTARAWEFSAGALLAAFPTAGAGLERLPLAGAGLSGIVLAALLFSVETAFPGPSALLPVAGAVLVIIGGRTTPPGGAYALLSSGPFRHFGDLSYSLYLWHWPLSVLWPQIVGRPASASDGAGVFLLSWALSWGTKTAIEDPCRARSFASRRKWHPFAFGTACVVGALLATASVRGLSDELRGIASSHPIVQSVAIRPSIMDAASDIPEVYSLACHSGTRDPEPKPCRITTSGEGPEVVLVGDSHAAQWTPALKEASVARGWRLTTYTKSGCSFGGSARARALDSAAAASCDSWNSSLHRILAASRPRLLITSQSRGRSSGSLLRTNQSAEDLAAAWERLSLNGIKVLAVADTPPIGMDVPECLSSLRGSPDRCSRRLAVLSPLPDPVTLAAARSPFVRLLDLTYAVCPKGNCAPIIDDRLVWRDSHHLTATFSRSLSEAFALELDAAATATQ